MSLIIGTVIGIGGTGFIIGVTKVGLELTRILLKRSVQKTEKKILKERLFKSIRDIDFLSFQNTIYDIKTYDSEYNKSLFTKMKKQYIFNDRHVNNFEKFNRRFNNEYEEDLTNLIKREISKSISTTHSILDL